jgi:hypothetical protein
VIENRTFRLIAGADEAAFVAADARFQTEVAYQQPGIARRTLAKGDDGEWLVVTHWWTVEHADAAPAMTDFVDPDTVVVRRYEELPG